MNDVVTLYRPVGPKELELIVASDYRRVGYKTPMRLLAPGAIAMFFALGVAACTPQQQAQSQDQVKAAVHSIPSPVKRGAEDAALTAKVAAAMAAQTGVNAFNVKPEVSSGVVTLTGKVPTDGVKATLLSAVRRVHGVTQIVDNVTVGR